MKIKRYKNKKNLTSILMFAIFKITKTTHPVSRNGAWWGFYFGFAHQPSFAMQRHSTLSRLLIKEELEPFANIAL